VPGAALGRLARNFPIQMRPHRYRNNGELPSRAERVGGDGGKAIVGNVTQHASVIVSDNHPAPAVTDARMVLDRLIVAHRSRIACTIPLDANGEQQA